MVLRHKFNRLRLRRHKAQTSTQVPEQWNENATPQPPKDRAVEETHHIPTKPVDVCSATRSKPFANVALRSFSRDALGVIGRIPVPGIDCVAAGLSMILDRIEAADSYNKAVVSFEERIVALAQVVQLNANENSQSSELVRMEPFVNRLERKLKEMKEDLDQAESRGHVIKFINSTDASASLNGYTRELDSIVLDWTAASGHNIRETTTRIETKLTEILDKHEPAPSPPAFAIDVQDNIINLSGDGLSRIVGVSRAEVKNNVISMNNGGDFGCDWFGSGSQNDPLVLDYLRAKQEQRRQFDHMLLAYQQQSLGSNDVV